MQCQVTQFQTCAILKIKKKCRSQWPRGQWRGSAAARFTGIAGSNPAVGIDISLF